MTLQFTIQLRTMWKWKKGNIDKISKIGHERADRADSRQAEQGTGKGGFHLHILNFPKQPQAYNGN